MKTALTTTVLFTLSCLLLFACKKKELTFAEKLQEKNAGTVVASFNGKPWKHDVVYATTEAGNQPYFSFTISVYENEVRTQSFDFTGINPNEHINKLHQLKEYNPKIAKAMFYNTDDHQSMDRYLVIEDYALSSFVKIDNYDPVTSKVKGSFEVHMYKDYGATPGFPDTLHFTGGTFDFKISPATL